MIRIAFMGIVLGLAGIAGVAHAQMPGTAAFGFFQQHRLLDGFTDTNGTSLTAHAMAVGPGWTLGSGTDTPTIQGNQASLTLGNSKRSYMVSESGVADGVVEATFTVTFVPNHLTGIVFRWVDSSNYWLFWYETDTGHYQLAKVVNGASTNTVSFSASWPTGTTRRLMVVLNGSNIDAYVDGVSVATTSSTDLQSATKHGFAVYTGVAGSGTFTVSNFSVK